MLTEVSAHTAAPAPAPPTAPADAAPARSAWWVRLLARVPWGVGYGFAMVLGWLAFRVFPYRERLVRGNLTRAFPHFDEPELRAVMRGYYLGFAQMLVEIIKGASLPGRSEEHTSELQSRVDLVCRLLLEKKKAVRRQGR